MDFGSFSILVDATVSILLVAVIFYTIRLNQHFKLLQKNRAELARQLSGFAHSTERAEAAIAQVRQSTAESSEKIESLLQRGETLRADLDFLVNRAGAAADHLENSARQERANAGRTGGRGAARGGGRDDVRSRRSRRLGGDEKPADSAEQPEAVAEAPGRAGRVRPQPEEAPGRAQPEMAASAPATRRRRGGGDKDGADGDRNSELLKVLQGMR